MYSMSEEFYLVSKYVFISLVQALIRRHNLSGKLWMKVMDNTGPVTYILYALANTTIKRQHYGPVAVHDSVDQSKQQTRSWENTPGIFLQAVHMSNPDQSR
jgi:hypothetical protein